MTGRVTGVARPVDGGVAVRGAWGFRSRRRRPSHERRAPGGRGTAAGDAAVQAVHGRALARAREGPLHGRGYAMTPSHTIAAEPLLVGSPISCPLCHTVNSAMTEEALATGSSWLCP